MNTFALTTVYHSKRPMSWSAISSFEWNKAQWYRRYVLKELQEESPEMKFGKHIDEKVQKDRKFLTKLPRYPIQQHEMRTVWNGIPLIGYSDQYRPKPLAIRDLKTGRKAWDQKRADETGQLTMYLFMLYLMDKKIKVADAQLFIDWLPTHIESGKVQFIEPISIKTFKTKRSMRQILEFGQRILDTYAAMEEYASREMGSVVHSKEEFF